MFFFCCEGCIERQETKMQNMSNIGGMCKFICEVHFYSRCFFAIRWSVFWSFQTFILVLNFIFIIFQSLVGERRERKLSESDLERERCHFNNFSHQNINFLFHMVPYDEGSFSWVFFSPWKCLKIQI